jgi:hypothetical protein
MPDMTPAPPANDGRPHPFRRLGGSRKFWVSFASGIVAVGSQMLPFFATFWGWSPEKQLAFSSMCNAISMIVGGMGGVLTVMIGTEDAAEKVALPPPTIVGLPPRGEGD